MMIKGEILLFAALLLQASCTSREIRPVEIYAEDMCARCRMAVSDQRFASELITEEREVFKFDDIGCMEAFRKSRPDVGSGAVFVKDYDSKSWLPLARAVIVPTGITTPMGSGLVAFSDSLKARHFAEEHPAVSAGEMSNACCRTEKEG